MTSQEKSSVIQALTFEASQVQSALSQVVKDSAQKSKGPFSLWMERALDLVKLRVHVLKDHSQSKFCSEVKHEAFLNNKFSSPVHILIILKKKERA